MHHFEIHITPEQAGTYFNLPFTVPEGVEKLTLKYAYMRRLEQGYEIETGCYISRQEVNIIDLGLIGPDGRQVGASGSNKTEIFVSEAEAAPGYKRTRVAPGEWQVIVGAYKVAPEGVTVTYEINFEFKHLRLLRGDLHVHTVGSDGVHTLEELAWKAKRNRLDFIAVTDHNQMVSSDELPQVPGVTMLPGVEWTHFKGHASFIGVDRPYDEPFAANTIEEIHARFASAHERGALITIDHPFDELCPFTFDIQTLPFDCIEIWNAPMRESNLRSIGFWQQLLASGKKIPITSGSDYHRDKLGEFLGGPTLAVYAMSAGPSDILEAIRTGRAFITFEPEGPTVELTAGDASMGGAVQWNVVKEMQITASGLAAGDVLRVVTGVSSTVLLKAPTEGKAILQYRMSAPGFVRVEVLRAILPGLPVLPVLISNPIYFD